MRKCFEKKSRKCFDSQQRFKLREDLPPRQAAAQEPPDGPPSCLGISNRKLGFPAMIAVHFRWNLMNQTTKANCAYNIQSIGTEGVASAFFMAALEQSRGSSFV